MAQHIYSNSGRWTSPKQLCAIAAPPKPKSTISSIPTNSKNSESPIPPLNSQSMRRNSSRTGTRKCPNRTMMSPSTWSSRISSPNSWKRKARPHGPIHMDSSSSTSLRWKLKTTRQGLSTQGRRILTGPSSQKCRSASLRSKGGPIDTSSSPRKRRQARSSFTNRWPTRSMRRRGRGSLGISR